MKIIIIGCPGAGKSVLTRRINEFLCYPVMHLDKVYHTSGKSHITREELIRKVNDFANRYDMAEGFDGTITEEFVSFIKNFPKDTMPKIQDILKNYNDKNVKIISNYKELEEVINFFKKDKH